MSTGSISKVENPTLSPVYGDILSPAATSPVNVTVHSATSNFGVKSQGGKALVLGKVSPGTGHVKGTVAVFARAVGKKGAFQKVATQRLAATQGNFAISVPLAAASWNIKVKFSDPKQVVAASSKTVKVTIGPKPTSRVSLRSFKTKDAGFTVTGRRHRPVRPGPRSSCSRSTRRPARPPRFKVLGTAKLGAGRPRSRSTQSPGAALGAATRVRPTGRGAELLGVEDGHVR